MAIYHEEVLNSIYQKPEKRKRTNAIGTHNNGHCVNFNTNHIGRFLIYIFYHNSTNILIVAYIYKAAYEL